MILSNTVESSGSSGEPEAIECQNALVTRIALFLNYLSKDSFKKLLRDVSMTNITSEGDLLKLMISRRYISPKYVSSLKKTCLSFARAQEDTRFGSLCIQFDFLTQSNLNLALEEQKALTESGRTIFLGDLLVEAGMLSDRQQKLILQKQKMDHTFKENAPVFQGNAREIREKHLVFYIPEDALKAFMVKTEQFDIRLFPLETLKEKIEDNGIIYGVVPDTALEEFLRNETYATTHFELATGLEPVPGIDARIFYLFERNYLTAGQVSGDGSIDFKSRGELPFVAAEDILAEKIPYKTGRDGVNVFGDVVEAEPPLDIDILCGKGTVLSECKLKAYAVTDGYPKLSPEGLLTVNDAHVIKGDVDYTTGHIKFDKNVFITGTIKSGFKVEARDVVARAVDGGTIYARGDVAIANGITDATITAKGGVTAGFVHRSRIACQGNIDIEKEVVESHIILEGTFEMQQGKMYASTLSARGGAKIYHIGSVKTVPSVIVVGTSPYMKNELKRVNREIEKSQNLLDNKNNAKIQVEADLNKISHELDHLNKGGKNLEGQGAISPERINGDIAKHRYEKRQLEKKSEIIDQDLVQLTEFLRHWVAEKFNLKKQSHTNPPKPILDVRGRILAGTQVRGRYSATVMSSDLSRVRVIEMSCPASQGKGRKAWEMITTRL